MLSVPPDAGQDAVREDHDLDAGSNDVEDHDLDVRSSYFSCLKKLMHFYPIQGCHI